MRSAHSAADNAIERSPDGYLPCGRHRENVLILEPYSLYLTCRVAATAPGSDPGKSKEHPRINEETYRMKNYELELQKQIERSRHWLWQRGVWIAALAIAGTSLVYEIAGRAA